MFFFILWVDILNFFHFNRSFFKYFIVFVGRPLGSDWDGGSAGG